MNSRCGGAAFSLNKVIRVLGGTIRGKKLFSPAGLQFRPATGRVKEFIFSYLGEIVEGARLLDLFAGTGALGIEALSRGAREVVFVDCAISSIELLKKNIKTCHLLNKAFPVYGDVFHVLPKVKQKYEHFDIVIADPPFKDGLREKIVRIVSENALLHPGGYLIIEHDIRDPDSENHPMTIQKQRHFGHCAISIYT